MVGVLCTVVVGARVLGVVAIGGRTYGGAVVVVVVVEDVELVDVVVVVDELGGGA